MAPNLVVATKKLFTPHKWFAPSPVYPNGKPERKSEHWDSPVAGTYEYVPGRGWSLVAIDKPAAKLIRPIPVRYSRVLKRYLLVDDYNDRKCFSPVQNSQGKDQELGFFRLDDGVAWVNYLDVEGNFISGPYKLWCIDQKTSRMRAMLKGDDPNRSRQASRAPSRAPSPCSACRSNSKDDVRPHNHGRSTPMTPFTTTPAQSRPTSIHFLDASSRAASTSASSIRSGSKHLSAGESTTTAPTTPSDSLNDPLELSSKLEAIKRLSIVE